MYIYTLFHVDVIRPILSKIMHMLTLHSGPENLMLIKVHHFNKDFRFRIFLFRVLSH